MQKQHVMFTCVFLHQGGGGGGGLAFFGSHLHFVTCFSVACLWQRAESRLCSWPGLRKQTLDAQARGVVWKLGLMTTLAAPAASGESLLLPFSLAFVPVLLGRLATAFFRARPYVRGWRLGLHVHL